MMNRWIDADAFAYIVACNGDADFINKITKFMAEAPSIDIVFCKECKHRYTPDCFRAYLEYDIQEWIVDSGEDDDFCSWGERGEE